MPNVVVYVPAKAWRDLEAGGERPALWVRLIVQAALAARAGE